MRSPKHSVSDELLDRLVDNELPEDQRRRLLAELERRPDQWRRCALAFLEAQAWSSGLREMLAGDQQGGSRLAARGDQLSRKWFGSSWLALAASGLIAFALGWFSQEVGIRTRPQPEPVVRRAVNAAEVGEVAGSDELVGESASAAAGMPNAYRDLIRAWEQAGLRVERRRAIVPAVEDGRAMWIPVEDFYVAPRAHVIY